MPIKFTLKETMDHYQITQNALSVASGVRNNTISALRKGEAKVLTVEKLDALIIGLESLTGEKHTLESVMIYEDSE